MPDQVDAVARLLEARSRSRRILIAVDGIGGSGKSTLAASLQDHLTSRSSVLLHADDFLNPTAVRHSRGRLSPEGFWLDTYDYDTLTSRALDPLRSGDGHYWRSSVPTTPDEPHEIAPLNAIVIVEGTFLLRDRLQHYWDFSIFLDVSFETATQRMIKRGTIESSTDPRLDRYFGAQQLYFQHAQPWTRASLIVDNSAEPAVVATARHAAGDITPPHGADER